MKIAMIRHNLDRKDGGARHLLWLAKEFKRLGHEVYIYTQIYNPKECFPEIAQGLNIISVNLIKETPIAKIIRYFKGKMLYAAERLMNLMENDFDIINPHESPGHWAAVLYKRKKGTPIVWLCSDVFDYLPIRLRELKPKNILRKWIVRLIFRWVDKKLIKDIDQIIVLDNRMKKIVDRIHKVDSIVVRSGIDIKYLEKFISSGDRELILKKFNFSSNSFIILCAAIMHPYRRFEDVIMALKILIDKGYRLNLVIVGDPADSNYVDSLTKLTTKLGLTNYVNFDLRFINDEELFKYYQACDVYVFPNYEQTWGMSVLEAMVFGKPCIVSTGTGVHEVLKDGEEALLVPPKNPEVLAQKLKMLIEDPNLREKLSRLGRDFVYHNISWEKEAMELIDIFNKNLIKE